MPLPQSDNLARVGQSKAEPPAQAELDGVLERLTRTRQTRDEVERRLRTIGLTDAQIAGCVATATADAGPMDVQTILGVESPRKESPVVRSQEEKAP